MLLIKFDLSLWKILAVELVKILLLMLFYNHHYAEEEKKIVCWRMPRMLVVQMQTHDLVLVNLSGRGDKDINTVADLEGIEF